MDLNLINIANTFYKSKGFKYIDTPWLVDIEAYDSTTPESVSRFNVKDKYLVASGEQSFIDMMSKKQLPNGRYCTTTPCFRDDIEDNLHKRYFLKTELIDTLNVSKSSLSDIIEICVEFFTKFTDVSVIQTGNESYDIIDLDTKIELGSYGIRSVNNLKWVYATGLAEPRLSYVLSENKSGYHETIIPKGTIGEFSKIEEEFEELKDAYLQNNKILILCELSDIIGSIDLYLTKNFNGIKLDDIIKMKDLTQRSFENNIR